MLYFKVSKVDALQVVIPAEDFRANAGDWVVSENDHVTTISDEEFRKNFKTEAEMRKCWGNPAPSLRSCRYDYVREVLKRKKKLTAKQITEELPHVPARSLYNLLRSGRRHGLWTVKGGLYKLVSEEAGAKS
jgi:hypothetical protein